jgi:hypothetical protein
MAEFDKATPDPGASNMDEVVTAPKWRETAEFVFQSCPRQFLILVMANYLYEGLPELVEFYCPGWLQFVIPYCLTCLMAGGYWAILIAIAEKRRPEILQIFKRYKLFLKYLGADFLSGLATVIGLLLLVAPGVWLAVCLCFYPLIIADKGLGPLAAIGLSRQLTRGHLLSMFASFTVLGFMALSIFLIFGIPIGYVCHSQLPNWKTEALFGLVFNIVMPLAAIPFPLGLAYMYCRLCKLESRTGQ